MGRNAMVALTAGVSVAACIALFAAKPAVSDFSTALSQDQKIVHALNRLTFGPRPGDVAAVAKMGLKKWIDLELHPDHIAQTPELAAKLKPLDTIRMSPTELVRNYPPPQQIRSIAEGKGKLPSDPEKSMMVENAVRRYQAREGKDAGEKPTLDNVGLTEEQQSALRRGTPEEKLKVFDSLLDEQKDEVLMALPMGARMSLYSAAPPDLRRRIEKSAAGPAAIITQDLSEAKLLRAVYSNRQLEEVLTDFWYNHFNVFLGKGVDRYFVASYEREVIGPRVLGKFKDLLRATAESPAMLFYLDNFQSVDPQAAGRLQARRGMMGRQRPGGQANRRGLNENYARELMELHTLGVDGGYTQQDVTEVARCFTGWTIDAPRRGGGFIFRPMLHDNGEKTVLGVRIPRGGGMQDGLKVLDILAHHPSTARFISKKLAIRFVVDNPPDSLVSRMAATFTEKDGDLRAVMETMLNSPEFWSQGAYRAKLKSPLEMMASAIRALDADVDFAFALNRQLVQLGEPLYRKQEPTGYSNAGQEWMNSAALVARMNFALALAGNRIPGVKVNEDLFPANATIAQVARELLGTDLSSEASQAIERGLRAGAKQDSAEPAAAAGEPTGNEQAEAADSLSPGRQPVGLLPPRRVSQPLMIAALTLGSPDFQRR